MSKFDNIDFNKVNVWIEPVTHRITAKAFVGDEWHEVTFREGTITLQHMIDALKEDLREPVAPTNTTEEETE